MCNVKLRIWLVISARLCEVTLNDVCPYGRFVEYRLRHGGCIFAITAGCQAKVRPANICLTSGRHCKNAGAMPTFLPPTAHGTTHTHNNEHNCAQWPTPEPPPHNFYDSQAPAQTAPKHMSSHFAHWCAAPQRCDPSVPPAAAHPPPRRSETARPTRRSRQPAWRCALRFCRCDLPSWGGWRRMCRRWRLRPARRRWLRRSSG